MKVSCNTVLRKPTYFLNPLGVIEKGRVDFEISSENWPSPVCHIGTPGLDRYYAEIWQDGMDWQNTYWLVESVQYEDPIALPMIVFENIDDEEKVGGYLRDLMEGLMWVRRSQLLDASLDINCTFCEYLLCLCKVDPCVNHPGTSQLKLCSFSVGRTRVQFYLNQDVFHVDKMESRPLTFIEKCVKGEIKSPMEEILEFLEDWHSNPNRKEGEALHSYLGMTWNEYKVWIKNPNALLSIIKARL